jgi:septal ring factor EnvC (AmiA/AmiB activator)
MDKEILEILKRLESKIDENTQILRALEHSSQVNKAEHDNMANDIAHIKGDVEALRKDISTVEIVTANNYADIARLKAVK